MVRLLHYSDLENAFDDPDRLARVAGFLDRRRDATTIVTNGGDCLAPGVLAMETNGRHVLPFFDAVSPDVSTIGNHDFDLGVEPLRRVIANAPGTYLAANLHGEDGGQFGADVGVRSSVVLERDGTRVGVVGVTEPDSIRVHSGADGVVATDPAEAVAAELDHLSADRVVVVSHTGYDDDEIAGLDGVDAVLGGHDHRKCVERVDGTPVVRPGAVGTRVGVVDLTDTEPTATLAETAEADALASVRERYESLRAKNGLAEPVVDLDRPVSRGRDDRYPVSRVGNFVADAIRWGADADVAVVHPGMLRGGSPLAGTVVTGDVRALTPFDSELYLTALSGADLANLFESFAFPAPLAAFDIGPEVYGHVSGSRLRWDRTDETLELVDVEIDGRSPRPSETFVVAAPAYEFEHSLYPALDATDARSTGVSIQDVLVEFASESGIPTTVDERMSLRRDETTRSLFSL